jgi:hypothetical protein
MPTFRWANAVPRRGAPSNRIDVAGVSFRRILDHRQEKMEKISGKLSEDNGLSWTAGPPALA